MREPASALRRGENISRRATGLAAEIIAIVRQLPRDAYSRHVGLQLMRSGTSAGANYEEARAAESRADFIHKVGVACKELRETIYWLNLVEKGWPRLRVSSVRGEATELSAILMASRRTARAGA